MHHHEVPLSISKTDSQLAGERFKVRKVYGCPVHGMGGLMIASQMSVHLEEHDEIKHFTSIYEGLLLHYMGKNATDQQKEQCW